MIRDQCWGGECRPLVPSVHHEESLPSGPVPLRHASPSTAGRSVSSVRGQAGRTPAHTRGAPPRPERGWGLRTGPRARAAPPGGGGAPDQGASGASGAPASAPGVHAPRHGGEPAYRSRQRRGARVPVTARWPVWLPGTWPRVPGVAGSADGDPPDGHAHSSVCACAELRGAQAFCPSSVSQGALDGGFYTGASSLYDGNSKPAFVKIVGRTYPFQKSLRNTSEESVCQEWNRWGAPATGHSEPRAPSPSPGW